MILKYLLMLATDRPVVFTVAIYVVFKCASVCVNDFELE